MPEFKDTIYKYHRKGDHSVVYIVADQDEISDTLKYYGLVTIEGDWYIMKEEKTGTITSFSFYRKRVPGESGEIVYATAWGLKASLSYQRFDLEFG